MKEEINYPLWLHTLEGIGCKKAGWLIRHYGCAKNVFFSGEEELKKVPGITEEDRRTILYRRNRDDILKKQEELLKKRIDFLSLEDRKYPEKLRYLTDPPYGLYIKGKMPEADKVVIAMVGARMCSPYGKAVAEQLAYALGKAQVEVISGMARGIDAFSHKGCLKSGGTTYAVLAGGVDVIYPPEHKGLYEEILQNGGIISEYHPGSEPLKGMFPQRNRIISGLADKVVIVEAKQRSGSLITADFALEQGKDVYVVPGRINDPLSVGCNHYIKQGADIIESISDFLRQINLSGGKESDENVQKNIFLEKEESIVYSCLRLTPSSLQEIMGEANLDLLTVIRCINQLEEKGLAEEYYKNYYIRSM